jgi:hypothetical protein
MIKALTRNKRERFVVYPPGYTEGGMFKRVTSWYKVNKLCKKWGGGTKVHVKVLRPSHGSKHAISFWRTESVFTWG